MTEPLFYTSAPVFRVDGAPQGDLARDLVRLEIDEGTDGLKTLVVRFAALDPGAVTAEGAVGHLDGTALDFGRELEVAIGPPSAARTVFRGRISALEASFEEGREAEVVAFAEDRLMDLRMARRMRTYTDLTDAEIAEEIAAEHGLAAEVDADGPRYDRVQQWNQSDLAFLRERARRVRAEVWVVDDTLFFQGRSARRAPELTLVRGNHVLSLDARADLAHQRTAVRVSGYDAARREGIDEEAGADAIDAEIEGGLTGPAVLARTFGDRASHRVRDVPLVAGEAADWARAEMLRRGRGFVQVSGVTRGTPDLTVGSRLTLERVGTPFAGAGYYVTRVCHTYDLDQGHRTLFEAERATIEGAA